MRSHGFLRIAVYSLTCLLLVLGAGIGALWLDARATDRLFDQVVGGMTPDDVRSVMGPPSSVTATNLSVEIGHDGSTSKTSGDERDEFDKQTFLGHIVYVVNYDVSGRMVSKDRIDKRLYH